MRLTAWDGRLNRRPAPVIPMEPHLRRSLTGEAGYRYEVKWDGIRLISWVSSSRIMAHTRHGRWCEEKYPELNALPRQLDAASAVVDGELVSLVNGRPSFRAMMVRHMRRTPPASGAPSWPVIYVIFDCLYIDGHDIRSRPWLERTRLLEERVALEAPLHRSAPREDGEGLLQRVREERLEGIVAKRIHGPYQAGKGHDDWFKVKGETVQAFTICGYRAEGPSVRSLMLAEAGADRRLHYVGRVGSGIDAELGLRLYRQLQPLESDRPTASGAPHLPSMRWVEPVHTCRVRYLMRTADGGLRHPVLVGLGGDDR